jgi:hypothetical protein
MKVGTQPRSEPSPSPLTSPNTTENASLRRATSSDSGVWPSSTVSFCRIDWTYGARSGSGRLCATYSASSAICG